MLQDIDTVSNVQRYRLGVKYALDDRAFRYGKAGGTLNPDLGAKNTLPQHIATAAIQANALKGDRIVAITIHNTDGIAGDGVIQANELAGGYVVIWTHAGNTINRRIVANTATTHTSLVMVLTLDKPLPCALTATTMHAECMASPYLNVQTSISDKMSVVGIPTMLATINQYLWLQTWGPIWIAPQAEVSVGSNNRQVVFRHDGSIDEYDATDPNTIKAQHAGFVLANAPGGGQGAAFIFLQITP